jgi:hypothetical protein
MQIFEDMFGGRWSPITGCTGTHRLSSEKEQPPQ